MAKKIVQMEQLAARITLEAMVAVAMLMLFVVKTGILVALKGRLAVMQVAVTIMGPTLQSQNHVDDNYEKITGPIFLKF